MGKNKTLNKFEITNTDKRKEFVEAFESRKPFISQRPGWIKFNDEYGFYLMKKDIEIDFEEKQIQRAYAIAKLSLEVPRLGLRELYYVLRQNPELVKYFDIRAEDLYKEIVDRINTLEILADVDRIKFTISTSSKGYIFYPFGYSFDDKRRRVAFTEELAVETIRKSDLPEIQSAIIIEKEAATNRLIEMGFPELTNSAVITVGGTFNRAVFRFTQRFAKEFPIIFFADGDVAGSKMLSLVSFGSKRSGHLSLRSRDSNIHIAGLFPFVGHKINLPNDVEEKRPLQNAWARSMMRHLKRFGLVDDKDLNVWEKDYTCELEALSTAFVSEKLKDEQGRPQPIGLGIYLTEYMRLMKIPPKPLPKDDVKDDFEWYVKDKIQRKLKPSIDKTFIIEAIRRIEDELESLIDEYQERVADEEFDKHKDEIEEFLDKTDVELIKKHLIAQYCRNMRKRIYNVFNVADKVIKKCKTEVRFDDDLFEEIRRDIEEAIEELIAKIKPKIEKLLENAIVESELELKELGDVKVCDLYDKILEELGAKPEDAEKVREALKLRIYSTSPTRV